MTEHAGSQAPLDVGSILAGCLRSTWTVLSRARNSDTSKLPMPFITCMMGGIERAMPLREFNPVVSRFPVHYSFLYLF